VKNKAATDGGESRTHRGVRRPLFAQDDDEVFVTGSTLYAEEVKLPPDTTHLVITPVSAPVGHRRTEPGGYFCRKLTLTRTPDRIRPTRRGPDPNDPQTAANKGGYDLGVFVRGGWSDTPRDNRRQQNRI